MRLSRMSCVRWIGIGVYPTSLSASARESITASMSTPIGPTMPNTSSGLVTITESLVIRERDVLSKGFLIMAT